MRAQLETHTNGTLPIEKVSQTNPVKYSVASKSCTGFPGGRVYAFYTNSTLERSTVSFSESTWSR